MSTLNEIEKKLKQTNQTHLLTYFNRLTDETKTAFLQHLSELDIETTSQLFQRAQDQHPTNGEYHKMEPIPASQFESEVSSTPETIESYRRRGLEAIANGEVGVLLMAGGQGTRLGVSHPKGMYSVGLPSDKTLFQIQAERIQRVEQLANRQTGKSDARIVWYIMTSGSTDVMTDDYLKTHNFFGLNPLNVVQFRQGRFPCFDFEGRIILEAADRVALAPDGNGGIYRALRLNRVLDDMEARGVKYIHAHSVDNILTKVADPVFIGYCIERGGDCGAKVVRKARPTEPLGVVCRVNGRIQVVEYSEISLQKANLRDSDGNLVYSAGNICNHFFTTAFLTKIANEFDGKLPLHVAKKKIPFCDETGASVLPKEPNGVKIEKFVFDVFQLSDHFVTWEVPRISEFSAMKNGDSVGKDCPKTARKDLLELHRSYIERCGGVVAEGVEVEISPLLSYAGEGLEEICKGRVFNMGTVLSAECLTSSFANGTR